MSLRHIFLRRAACGVALLFIGSACTASTAPLVPVALGADVTLAAGESAAITPGGLSFTFVSVTNDSRCPTAAQCVVAGSARVSLQTTSASGVTRTVVVETQSPMDTVSIDTYRIVLRRLAPVPTTTSPIPLSLYRATLRVDRVP